MAAAVVRKYGSTGPLSNLSRHVAPLADRSKPVMQHDNVGRSASPRRRSKLRVTHVKGAETRFDHALVKHIPTAKVSDRGGSNAQ